MRHRYSQHYSDLDKACIFLFALYCDSLYGFELRFVVWHFCRFSQNCDSLSPSSFLLLSPFPLLSHQEFFFPFYYNINAICESHSKDQTDLAAKLMQSLMCFLLSLLWKLIIHGTKYFRSMRKEKKKNKTKNKRTMTACALERSALVFNSSTNIATVHRHTKQNKGRKEICQRDKYITLVVGLHQCADFSVHCLRRQFSFSFKSFHRILGWFVGRRSRTIVIK